MEHLAALAGVVSLGLMAEALDVPPPLALGALFGALYLSLLARRALRLASLLQKRRCAARASETA